MGFVLNEIKLTLDALRPGRNPALRAMIGIERGRLGYDWFVLAFLFLALVHAVYAGAVSAEAVSAFEVETVFDLQFSCFHLVIYLAPLLILPTWRRLAREGFFQDLILTCLTRRELFMAFLAPRFFYVLVPILLFYLPMLPWGEWWLVTFGEDDFFLKVDNWRLLFPAGLDFPWTGFHMAITLSYFVVFVGFNVTTAGWLCLRAKGIRTWIASYLGLTVIGDFLAYTLYVGAYELLVNGDGLNVREWVGSFVEYPMILYTLLVLNGMPVFVFLFYPFKLLLAGLMVYDASRRVTPQRWARR